jgi:NAD(P)-dependent dehydrogenase (short-subunit alcohol dehydrogenase family)
MAAAGWGRTVNVSGLNARISGSLVELGPAGITVTVTHPGTTAIERTPTMPDERAARDGVPAEEVARRPAAATSIGRLVTAEEVADVVTFLASPRSAAIPGDPIGVGGGTRGSIHH